MQSASKPVQRRIQPLSLQLSNQIAAGEVVERPASVVKELLENSIDAGAENIELELERGGIKSIRLRDDGAGIHRDDLILAISPHATSKIYSQQELEQITSLGFRGEALASIASVCRFTLCSHQQGAEEAWRISNDKMGRLSDPAPGTLPAGTSVEVRDLFYNTPARRKFLRSERTEFLHVEEVLKRVALSRFDVAFSLIHNNRQNLRLRAAQDSTQKLKRVSDVLGNRFVQNAMTLEHEVAGMRLWGWLATPEYSRSQADSQYFYLNGRMIRDKLINHAVRQAHQQVMEPGRYPAYVLYLEVDPQQIDINVHPTKHEVRFRESRLVHDFVFRTLTNALDGQQQPSTTLARYPGVDHSSDVVAYSPTRKEAETRHQHGATRVADQMGFYRQAAAASRTGAKPHTDSIERPLGKGLALLYGRYLLAENAQGPLLLDLSAAREYLLSRRLQLMLADGEVQSQPLLLPITLDLDEKAIADLEPWLGELLRLGFVVERLGAESLVLRQVPALMRGADAELVLYRLITMLLEGQRQADSPELIGALVRGIVESCTLDTLTDAEIVLRELETLDSFSSAFWKPLPLSQLQQWMLCRE